MASKDGDIDDLESSFYDLDISLDDHGRQGKGIVLACFTVVLQPFWLNIPGSPTGKMKVK